MIEWALYNARITVILDDTIKVGHTIHVPVSDTTLIVGPDAELLGPGSKAPRERAGVGAIPAVIRNTRDNVRIFNLGRIATQREIIPFHDLAAVFFDGRNGGKNGIHGGLIFSTGATGKFNAPYWVVDSANVEIPLVWSKEFGHAVLAMEGTEDVTIGLVAGLYPSDYESAAQSETTDLNSFSKRTRIEHVIGTFVKGQQDEILDLNNSPNTVAEQVVGYGKIDQSADELIGRKGSLVDTVTYGPKSRRLTQKPYINHSKGTEIKNAKIVNNNVEQWKTFVEPPGFPDALPVLRIIVRLAAVFEDGTAEEVFAKKYEYDL